MFGRATLLFCLAGAAILARPALGAGAESQAARIKRLVKELGHDEYAVREKASGELAKLPTDRIPTRRDWSRLSGEWMRRIDNKIAELQRLKAGLTQCIGCGCLSIDRCNLANPADRAGRAGSGPRYWLG